MGSGGSNPKNFLGGQGEGVGGGGGGCRDGYFLQQHNKRRAITFWSN